MASQLSPRQREILDLVAEGRTSKEIAVTLGISESTVNWHIANAFERLGASSRAEAVARAIRSNGTDRPSMPPAVVRPAPAPTPTSWPRLVAIAIAIALAGALIGGATVATLHLGAPDPTMPPANGGERAPTVSPASGSADVVGGGTSPVASPSQVGDATEAPLLDAPATVPPTVPPLPAVSAPPLPSVPVPVPTPALPTLPPTALPLPIPSVPLPVPTPTLPLP